MAKKAATKTATVSKTTKVAKAAKASPAKATPKTSKTTSAKAPATEQSQGGTSSLLEPILKNQKFFFAGRFEQYHWQFGIKHLENYVKNEGGKIVTKLDASVDYLLIKVAKGNSSHEKLAAKLNSQGANIKTITPEQLRKMIHPSVADALALFQLGRDGQIRLGKLLETLNWQPSSTDYNAPPFAVSGLSFKGQKLEGIPLWSATLTDCDLRETVKLGGDREYYRLADLTRCNLDGAKLHVQINSLIDCTCRKADLEGSWIGRFSGKNRMTGDFSNSKLTRLHASDTDCSTANFTKCDLENATFEDSKVREANFSNANLKKLRAKDADFTGSNFSKADLTDSDLVNAKFDKCDLSGAKFANSILTNVSMKNAILNGTDFTDCTVATVNFDGTDTSKAKGLKIIKPATQTAGPNLKTLAKELKSAKSGRFSIEIKHKEKHMRLDVEFSEYSKRHGGIKAGWTDDLWATTLSNWDTRKPTLEEAMLAAAACWPDATPLIHTVQAETKGAGIQKKKLMPMVISAWCEAFGMEVPDDTAIKQQEQNVEAEKDIKRAEIFAQFETKEGRENWNDTSSLCDTDLNPFRGFKFTGKNWEKIKIWSFKFVDCDFSKGKFGGCDLEFCEYDKCNFTSLSAPKSIFCHSSFSDCDFTKANLKGSSLTYCAFKNAKLDGTDLTDVNLSEADVRGVDFSKAKLSAQADHWLKTKFDEKTVFPKGFKQSDKMVWKGKGIDPRAEKELALVKAGGPIDLEQFMNLLNASLDKDKIKKAVSMLKKDRFKLFAEAQTDQLFGVVKSQSDAELVYSCRLGSDGTYTCCTQNLNVCGGLRGSICKHLLVLIIGATKGGELDPTLINQWVQASRFKKAELNREQMAEILLKYKGAEAGDVDWRPMETIPEDFYSL